MLLLNVVKDNNKIANLRERKRGGDGEEGEERGERKERQR